MVSTSCLACSVQGHPHHDLHRFRLPDDVSQEVWLWQCQLQPSTGGHCYSMGGATRGILRAQRVQVYRQH